MPTAHSAFVLVVIYTEDSATFTVIIFLLENFILLVTIRK